MKKLIYKSPSDGVLSQRWVYLKFDETDNCFSVEAFEGRGDAQRAATLQVDEFLRDCAPEERVAFLEFLELVLS